MDLLCGHHTPQEMLISSSAYSGGEQNLSSEKGILPDYEECLKCFNLLWLEKRRYLFDVTFLYKALNGYLNVDVSPFLNFYS